MTTFCLTCLSEMLLLVTSWINAHHHPKLNAQPRICCPITNSCLQCPCFPRCQSAFPIMLCCLRKISTFVNLFQLILTKSCNEYQQIMQIEKIRLQTDPDSVCRPSVVVSLRYSCEKCHLVKRKCVPSNEPGLPWQRATQGSYLVLTRNHSKEGGTIYLPKYTSSLQHRCL